jgi:hypothetical protein
MDRYQVAVASSTISDDVTRKMVPGGDPGAGGVTESIESEMMGKIALG